VNRLQDASSGGTQLMVSNMTISNPDAALHAISQAYAPSNLDVYGAPRDFGLRMHVASVPGITFGHIRFGTDVRVTALPPSCYVVCFALTGGLHVATTHGVQRVTGTQGAVLYPYEATYFEEWGADTELVSLRIETQYLERGLIQLIERPLREPIRFDPGCDLGTAQTASFRRALHLLEAELFEPTALATNPRASAMLGELITTSLLMSQPNNYSGIIHEPARPAPLGPVRTAQELIEADPMSISTVGELAGKVHASVRTLEQGFRKHLDTSPMAYLRRTRLHRAHRDLQLADPAATTVRRTANHWGFQHLGRFAQCYRDVFGELPVETLRRTRR
jgi:AraC-like DNA-binding protein